MKFFTFFALLFTNSLAFPSGNNNSGSKKTITNSNNSPTLDLSVSDAIAASDGSCKSKLPDYIFIGCGVQSVTLAQGVTFCYSNKLYLLLCTDPNYCTGVGLTGVDVRTKSISEMCSQMPPYYGAVTPGF
jgi:hypothetical protein